MQPDALPLTTSRALVQCPEFHLLVVGRSKAGKSSLVRHAFGIEMNIAQAASHPEPTEWNLNVGLKSMQNPRFVIHEFVGYETAELQIFEGAGKFLQYCSGDNVPLKDRVHAIWICIPVLSMDGHVFQPADEALLKLIKVPVVVVFTHFDVLINLMGEEISESSNMSSEEVKQLCLKRADARFRETCISPLEQINPELQYARTFGLRKDTISHQEKEILSTLIQTTRDLAEQYIERELWTASVTEQRASVAEKINTSIEIGMRRYWHGLASSTNFSLDRCLEKLHRQIAPTWKFDDPYVRLHSSDIIREIRNLAQPATFDVVEEKSWSEYLQRFQILVALLLGTTVAATVGPVAASLWLSVWFIQKVATMYYRMPDILRCFMQYVIDLVLVLDQLFHMVLSKPPRSLTKQDIDLALERYRSSTAAAQVRSELQIYADRATLAQILQRNRAEVKVAELIARYRIPTQVEG
ncbi:hypothetical protein GGX14DRAFT_541788 [Mycena pura]|uniref:G domain-containing protein n=1 Tax=Mycena pura TaxID=153505 RepID=A0AAD6VMG8_9AGAR|nr:hypothetical protein GGX14DRAFT_541788 [Mycena pura]